MIAVAEGYWRAFQTNGTENYHPAELLPDVARFENGLQTTGLVRNGRYASAAEGFDEGRFIGRNLWDRRYPVVDTERGIVLSIVRFGLQEGAESQSAATANDRLVAEFFAVKSGMIQEVHAVSSTCRTRNRRVGSPTMGRVAAVGERADRLAAPSTIAGLRRNASSLKRQPRRHNVRNGSKPRLNLHTAGAFPRLNAR